MAHLRSNVEGLSRALQSLQVAGEACPRWPPIGLVPSNARIQVLSRQARQRSAEAHPAVAHELQGYPLGDLAVRRGVDEELEIRVAVEIDESRRDNLAGRVHSLSRLTVYLTYHGDGVAHYGQVGPIPRRSGAAHNQAVPEDYVVYVLSQTKSLRLSDLAQVLGGCVGLMTWVDSLLISLRSSAR